MLERLNLYFNKISAFQEVMTLSKLKSLRELDLRLNPLLKKHPEYRLHLVHALCQLRKLGTSFSIHSASNIVHKFAYHYQHSLWTERKKMYPCSILSLMCLILDDCPVRDRERKAAIMHFSSDAELESQQKTSSIASTSDQRYPP